MRQVLLAFQIIFVAVALDFLSGAAFAQTPIRQFPLSERQVQGFIAAHGDMGVAARTMTGEKIDAAKRQQLDAIARKFGFNDFKEYEEVASNIALVMSGFDAKTKTFTEPPTAIRREINALMADRLMPEDERKRFLDELNKALKLAAPVAYPSNIELIKKFFDRLDSLM